MLSGRAKPRGALQENAVRDVPTTVLAKSKRTASVQPKILDSDRALKDLRGAPTRAFKQQVTPAVRPLGDKTPFPNRTLNHAVLPSETGVKIAKPALDGSLRVSSTRKHIRLPRSASKAFVTPVTGGNHWDVSDIDIDIGAVAANQSVEEEDHDEVEYMPPKVEEIPYEPPFEIPNYREVGETLMALIRSCPFDDDPPSDPSFSPNELEVKNNSIPLPYLEDDDLFAEENVQTTKQSRGGPPFHKVLSGNEGHKHLVTRSTARTPASTATTMTRKPSPTTRPIPPFKQLQANQPHIRSVCQPTKCTALSSLATRPSAVPRLAPSSRATKMGPPKAGVAVRPATSTSTRCTAKAMIPRPATGMASKSTTGTTNMRAGTTGKTVVGNSSKAVVRGRSAILEKPKDLEGLIIFEDVGEVEDFRFNI